MSSIFHPPWRKLCVIILWGMWIFPLWFNLKLTLPSLHYKLTLHKIFSSSSFLPPLMAWHKTLHTVLLIAKSSILCIFLVYINLVKLAVLLKLNHPGDGEISGFVAKITYFSHTGPESSSLLAYCTDHNQLQVQILENSKLLFSKGTFSHLNKPKHRWIQCRKITTTTMLSWQCIKVTPNY